MVRVRVADLRVWVANLRVRVTNPSVYRAANPRVR